VKISIIIPVLNERDSLPASLAVLNRQRWVHEIIVVDGGSTDGTQEWLRRQSDIKVIEASRGTGLQLNTGASLCTGDVLLFLHADTLLPENAQAGLESALADPQVAGGCFFVRFDRERPRSLGMVAAGINLRALLTRSATGDQAIFIRRDVFQAIGGFAEWPLFEDVEFVKRMKRAGKLAVVRSRVTVSARRHVRCGVFRTVMLCYLLRLGFWAGISASALAGWYRTEDHVLKVRVAYVSDGDPETGPMVTAPVAPAAWASPTFEPPGGCLVGGDYPRIRRL